MASSTHPLAEPIAALRASAGQLGGTHALLAALLLRLLGELLELLHEWHATRNAASPAAQPRPRRRGKGPMLRDWHIACHPTPKLRPSPSPPPAPRRAMLAVRAPPLRAPPPLRPSRA